jgi:hypothetical protein
VCLEFLDESRDRALREIVLSEDRCECLPDPPTVRSREVAAEDRLIDTLGAALVAWEGLAAPLGGRAVSLVDASPGDLQLLGAVLGQDAALDRSVTVACALLGPLAACRTQSLLELLLRTA